MSKPMRKGTKIVLGVLIASVLIAACFACVALYAKNEFEKEKSWLPPKPFAQQESVSECPDNAHDAYEYVMRLYGEALQADTVEGSWHTDVDLDGDDDLGVDGTMTLPFGEADNEIIHMIRDGAVEAVKALYPNVSGARMSETSADEIPELKLKESDILEYLYDASKIFNRKGEYVSNEYEIVFRIDPAFENADEIRHGSVYEGICETLKPAMTVNDVDLDVQSVEMRFKIDRLEDRLLSVVVRRIYEITANVTLTDDYAALMSDGTRTADVKFPYMATEHINFTWYGLHFTEDYLETNPDDIIVLPLDIHVNGAAVQDEDFTLTFTPSDPATMEVDQECVMTVNKTNEYSASKGVTLTATLEYEGKTYTDEIVIYITKLEKATTGVLFYEDGMTVAAGETLPMPVYIRVPINEQAESKREEEYSLSIGISGGETKQTERDGKQVFETDALSVEIDGKDLYVTGLKPSADPVTVTVTMNCGGHTYEKALPVTVGGGTAPTQAPETTPGETEGSTNG